MIEEPPDDSGFDKWLGHALKLTREGKADKLVSPDVQKKSKTRTRPKSAETYGVDLTTTDDKTGSRQSAVAQGLVRMLQKDYGDISAASIGDGERMMIVIPVPLALQVVLHTNGLMLGRLYQIVGEEESFKSTLACEFARFASLLKGMSGVVDTESKYTTRYAMSVCDPFYELGYPPLVKTKVKSVEGWQSKFMGILDYLKIVIGGKDGSLPRSIPSVMILDSLVGKLNETARYKTDKEGHASSGFATEANQNKRFMQTYSGELDEWPLVFVVVNHLNRNKTDQGFIEKKIPGGKFINFQKSGEIQMLRAGNGNPRATKPQLPGAVGRRFTADVIMSCAKSSLSTRTGEQLAVPIWWEEVYDPNKPEWAVNGGRGQVTCFDWGHAIVSYLLGFQEQYMKDQIADVVDITQGSTQNRYYSKRLGISKSNALEVSEFGLVMEQDAEVVAGLQRVLNIQVYRTFQPGVDYLLQLASLKNHLQALENKS